MDHLLQNHFNNCSQAQTLKLSTKDLSCARSILDKCLIKQRKNILNLIRQQTNIKPNNEKNAHEKEDNNRKKCMARIHTGGQCSRKCKDINDNYCGGHIHSLPYGSINDPQETPEVSIEKKSRGRKSKIKENNIDIDSIDLTKYISTKIYMINDKTYLIDENNVIFSNNDNNTIVGRKVDIGDYIWF